VSARLGRGHEPGADPHPVGARGQRCGHPPGSTHPACSQHRHLDRTEHLRQQRQQPQPTAHVPARFRPLGDYEVAAGFHRRPSLSS
jgi:hypothetical protein